MFATWYDDAGLGGFEGSLSRGGGRSAFEASAPARPTTRMRRNWRSRCSKLLLWFGQRVFFQ